MFQLSNKIITTNYDTAFEIKIKELRKNTAYKGRNYELTLHKDPKKPLLFKLHGCYEAVDSMVLFPTQYNALYNTPTTDAEHSLLVLKNIIVNKSVLFIGCGMGDFQINSFFKKIKELQGDYNQKHFIIDTKSLDSSLDFLRRIPISDYAEISLVVDKLLEEKEKIEQQKTPEVQELERQLEDTKKQLKSLEYIKDDAERKDKLLEREALKYFERGLEFQLNNELEKAIKEYKGAVELKLDFSEAFYNSGAATGELAKVKTGTEAETLYHQAIEKYQKAIEFRSHHGGAYNNWGAILHYFAKTKKGEAREKLNEEAIEKFQYAIKFEPMIHQAYKNLGTVLGDKARRKSSEDAEFLFIEAFEKYQKAIEIKSDYREAFYNWGSDLLEMAKIKSDKVLLQEAREKLNKAVDLGYSCYNLACSYALLSDKENALYHLNKSLENKEVVPKYATEDKDFKMYWNDKDFKKIIQKYKDK